MKKNWFLFVINNIMCVRSHAVAVLLIVIQFKKKRNEGRREKMLMDLLDVDGDESF